MSWARVRELLFPRQEEQSPSFKVEVERQSLLGLRALGLLAAGATALIYLLGHFVIPTLPGHTAIAMDATQVAWACGLIAVSFKSNIAPYARPLGIASGIVSGALQTTSMTLTRTYHLDVLGVSPEQHFPVILALVLPAGVALMPLKPVHTLAIGGALLVFFTSALSWLHGSDSLASPTATPIVFSISLVAIFVVLTAMLYDQRAQAFLARERAETSFELLKKAEASLLVERNATSQSQFAAALSHELGTPLGALASTFATLSKLLERFDERLADDPRRKEVLDDAMASARKSFGRVEEIAARMRQLTNLDRAEQQRVDINEICSETIAFLKTELAPARVEINTNALPHIDCRPHQISAVLSNLLRNAAAAIEDGGEIEVTSAREGSDVVIRIRDDGRGIEPNRLETIFDPDFKVEDGRVATSNWGLFVSRSIVTEHGGRLELDSAPGEGTTATMRLPT